MTYLQSARRALLLGASAASLLILQTNLSSAQSNGNYPYFAGPYIGLTAGYGFGETDWSNAPGSDFDGGAIGIQLGYGIQLPEGWTFGLEGVLLNGPDGDGGAFGGGSNYGMKADWLTLANLKLGFASGPTHFYLMGGYAGSRINSFVGGDADRSTHHGWNVGAGLEYAWDFDKTFGVTYNYIDLDGETHGSTTPRSIEPEMHLFRAYVNIKLAPPQAAFGN